MVRPEVTALIPTAGPAEDVLPDGEKEIAELIGTAADDLTDLPFGFKSRMWMSRSAQRSDDSPVNRAASEALKITGLLLTVKGPVVVHHEETEMRVRGR